MNEAEYLTEHGPKLLRELLKYLVARGPALKNLSRPKVEWGLICSPAH